jgi:hypothetical protein
MAHFQLDSFVIHFTLDVTQILAEEITPTLKRLKDERSSYLEFQKVTREVEQLSRFTIAYQFVQDEVSAGKSRYLQVKGLWASCLVCLNLH